MSNNTVAPSLPCSARDAYSCASRAVGNGFVEPSRRQIVDGFGQAAPDKATTGTSTGGVRIPPADLRPIPMRELLGVVFRVEGAIGFVRPTQWS